MRVSQVLLLDIWERVERDVVSTDVDDNYESTLFDIWGDDTHFDERH